MAGFTWLDYLIVAAYLAGVTVLGSLFASGQKSSRDFFLAGRGMSWFPMALSVIATDFSAISFLGAPGYVVAHDLVIDLQPLVFIWVLPISLYLFVRFFHRLELISAYEYLEKRFNLALRTGCSLLFICLRVSWMATALYATSLALTQATPLPFWLCAVLIGGLTTFYSSLGGMKAVIWTDVSQFFIFVTAIALVLVRAVGSLPGGVVMAWDTANRAGHTRLLNFEGGWDAITTPAVLIGGSFLVLISYGVDQVVIQRYLTARSVDEIKRSMVFQVCAAPGLLFMLAVIGLAVFSFYSHFPERIPEGLETDKWFPYFIVHELPMGFSGLVIAGLFAATMSSISSGVNSITAACVIDFYRRLLAGDSRVMQKQGVSPSAQAFAQQNQREIRISRILSVFWGAAATALAFVVGRIGVIAIIAKTLSGFFGGVLLGVFLLGILAPRVNGPGALLGGLIGFATISTVGLATPINLFWYAPIGCLTTLVAGTVVSRFFALPSGKQTSGLTLKAG